MSPGIKSLRVYIILWVVVILLLVIGATSYVSMRLLTSQHTKAASEQLMTLANTINNSISDKMELGHTEDVQKILERIGREKNIASVYIFDLNGIILRASVPGEIGQQLEGNQLDLYLNQLSKPLKEESLSGNLLSIISPFYNEPRCYGCHGVEKKALGFLKVEMSLRATESMIGTSRRFILLSSLITILTVSLALVVFFSYTVKRPLDHLIQVMKQVGGGDWTARASSRGGEEFAQLDDNFNAMVEELKKLRDDSLQKERDLVTAQERLKYREHLENINLQLERRVAETERANIQIKHLITEVEGKNVELMKVAERLSTINQISQAMSSLLNIQILVKLILEMSVRIMEASVGAVMLIDNNNHAMSIKYAVGLEEKVIKNISIKIGEGIAGRVALERRPCLIKDVEKDERFRSLEKWPYETGSMIYVPLIVRDQIIGVLNVGGKIGGGGFTEQDLELMNTLASQAAISLENARLYEAVQGAYFNTIRTLVNALEAKDKYTQGHSERVTRYSTVIAEEMGVERQQIELLQHAAALHDIGKLTVDLQILHKTGSLTPEELKIIQAHPLVGEKIIEPLTFLSEVRTRIQQHHEWFNGRGYPHKVGGEGLHLEARILAVADAFDAMTSQRPYRPAMTKEAALTELKRCAGSQFDPQVVEAFVRVADREELM